MPYLIATHPVYGRYSVAQSDTCNFGLPHCTKGWNRVRSTKKAQELLSRVESLYEILTHVVGADPCLRDVPVSEFTFEIIGGHQV